MITERSHLSPQTLSICLNNDLFHVPKEYLNMFLVLLGLEIKSLKFFTHFLSILMVCFFVYLLLSSNFI